MDISSKQDISGYCLIFLICHPYFMKRKVQLQLISICHLKENVLHKKEEILQNNTHCSVIAVLLLRLTLTSKPTSRVY